MILLYVVALGGLAFVLAKMREWLGNEKFLKNVDIAVEAAEQSLKAVDSEGTKRFDFVVSFLRALGYIITSEVKTCIEASVYRLNQEQKKSK